MTKKFEIRNSTAEFLTFVAENKEDGVQVVYKDETIWATRELVMNALCHRDYESNGPILFYQYADRIEIENHGGLYGRANVQNKHVEYQIGKVEAGGIGVQINGSSRNSGKPNKVGGFKVTSAVFTYKWAKQYPERLTDFYQYLVKLRAIDRDTDHEEFENLFSGVPTDIIVRWLAPKSALKALMVTLKERNYIEPAGRIWKITESHFKDKGDNLFANMRNEHNPEGLEKTINLIADVLDPQKKVQHLDMIEEDQADELWYGIRRNSFKC